MSQTRQIRRAALKLVATPAVTEGDKHNRIVHDSRGSAVWVGEPSELEDLSSLTLIVEPSAPPVIEGDPYNRPATAFGSRSAPSLKASHPKRRR